MSVYISGAVDVRLLTHNDRKFILFSDVHGGFEGTCPGQCITSKDNIKNANDTCYTVDGAIKKIILHAYNNNQYVDIFLESNFYGDPPHRTLITDPYDPLDVTTRSFMDCLYNKPACLYKNARFHYTDIRQGLSKSSRFLGVLPNLLDSIRYINKLSLSNTLSNYVYFFVNNYILNLFISSSSLTKTNLWSYINILLNSDDYITDVTLFLDELLVTNSHMINIYITSLSNKFKNVSKSRISSVLNKLLESTFTKIRSWSLEPAMIVSRENKFMSRIKAQLNGLINQGDSSLEHILRQYITQKLLSVNVEYLYKSLNTQYTSVFNHINSLDISNSSIFSHINLPENPVLYITSYIMDLYTIARMFRTFPTNYRYNKSIQSHHIPSSYVVIYEGKAHINTISDFLQSIGAVANIYNSIPKYKRCTNIPLNDFL